MSVSSTSTTRYKTGQICPLPGDYQFDGYTDGTSYPSPTPEELVIPLDKGDTFPPIRSSGKACFWRLIRRK